MAVIVNNRSAVEFREQWSEAAERKQFGERKAMEMVWGGGFEEGAWRDKNKRDTQLSLGWASNGHLVWQLVHEAVRLSICQNAPSAVLTLLLSLSRAHTQNSLSLFPLALWCVPQGSSKEVTAEDNGCGIVTWCSMSAYRPLSLWWFDAQLFGSLSLVGN